MQAAHCSSEAHCSCWEADTRPSSWVVANVDAQASEVAESLAFGLWSQEAPSRAGRRGQAGEDHYSSLHHNVAAVVEAAGTPKVECCFDAHIRDSLLDRCWVDRSLRVRPFSFRNSPVAGSPVDLHNEAYVAGAPLAGAVVGNLRLVAGVARPEAAADAAVAERLRPFWAVLAAIAADWSLAA